MKISKSFSYFGLLIAALISLIIPTLRAEAKESDIEVVSDAKTSYLVCCDSLKVRTEPNFDCDKVTSYPYGHEFEVERVITLDEGASLWGEIDEGYICLYSNRLAHAKINIFKDMEGVSDEEILARVMWHEAHGEGRKGLIAVGEVISNRMESDYFPDTLKDVVFQPGQFENVQEIAICYPTPEVLEIAKQILDGNKRCFVLRDPDILFFRNAHGYEGNWGRYTFEKTINHHQFYSYS